MRAKGVRIRRIDDVLASSDCRCVADLAVLVMNKGPPLN
jgi:hypothetical protein